jgi:hypothetical protein
MSYLTDPNWPRPGEHWDGFPDDEETWAAINRHIWELKAEGKLPKHVPVAGSPEWRKLHPEMIRGTTEWRRRRLWLVK